jgi:hypothetical protein
MQTLADCLATTPMSGPPGLRPGAQPRVLRATNWPDPVSRDDPEPSAVRGWGRHDASGLPAPVAQSGRPHAAALLVRGRGRRRERARRARGGSSTSSSSATSRWSTTCSRRQSAALRGSKTRTETQFSWSSPPSTGALPPTGEPRSPVAATTTRRWLCPQLTGRRIVLSTAAARRAPDREGYPAGGRRRSPPLGAQRERANGLPGLCCRPIRGPT